MEVRFAVVATAVVLAVILRRCGKRYIEKRGRLRGRNIYTGMAVGVGMDLQREILNLRVREVVANNRRAQK